MTAARRSQRGPTSLSMQRGQLSILRAVYDATRTRSRCGHRRKNDLNVTSRRPKWQ